MTAQLTHETRLTSLALSTTSFPIIWCAGHLPAQNNNGHIFYQKLFLCINDGPVIVTGISLLYQPLAFYRDRHEQHRNPFPFLLLMAAPLTKTLRHRLCIVFRKIRRLTMWRMLKNLINALLIHMLSTLPNTR